MVLFGAGTYHLYVSNKRLWYWLLRLKACARLQPSWAEPGMGWDSKVPESESLSNCWREQGPISCDPLKKFLGEKMKSIPSVEPAPKKL